MRKKIFILLVFLILILNLLALSNSRINNSCSPIGDGLNDYFFIVDYKLDVVSYTMKIFNRFGDLIFENNSFNEYWSGQDKDGKLAPEGVYVYVIEVSTHAGIKHQFDGTVNLIR